MAQMLDASNQKVGEYYLPDHATEQTRLNFQHDMVRLILDGELGRAPVKNPVNVLDVATGTGIWAMQYGMCLGPEMPLYLKIADYRTGEGVTYPFSQDL